MQLAGLQGLTCIECTFIQVLRLAGYCNSRQAQVQGKGLGMRRRKARLAIVWVRSHVQSFQSCNAMNLSHSAYTCL